MYKIKTLTPVYDLLTILRKNNLNLTISKEFTKKCNEHTAGIYSGALKRCQEPVSYDS